MSRSRSRSSSPKPRPEKITEPSEEEANKGNCIYVRGLENHLDENDVKEGFEKFGEIVSVNCTMNPELHINRGFAFVQFKEVDDAKRAIDEMNGKEFHGRTLTVELSKRSKPYNPTPGVWFDPRDDRFRRDNRRRYDKRDDRRDDRYRRSYSRSRSRSRSHSGRRRRSNDRYDSRRNRHSSDRYDSGRRDRRDDRYDSRRSDRYH